MFTYIHQNILTYELTDKHTSVHTHTKFYFIYLYIFLLILNYLFGMYIFYMLQG